MKTSGAGALHFRVPPNPASGELNGLFGINFADDWIEELVIEQWIDVPNFTLYAEGDSIAGFDSVYLTTYRTRKDAAADHPTAYAWYDELIVSTQPIAVPKEAP